MVDGPNDLAADERELVLDAQGGRVESFEVLVRRYQIPLVHFLCQRTVDYQYAEDLAQEVFWRVYANLHRYRAIYAFKTWLFTIAHRLSVNHARKRRLPCPENSDIFEAVDQQRDISNDWECSEQRQRLWSASADCLSENQFTDLWL